MEWLENNPPVMKEKHELYEALPDAANSAAGEIPCRYTCLGRWVHGFPIFTTIPRVYRPTLQKWRSPSARLNEHKGAPPPHSASTPSHPKYVSDQVWNLAICRVDGEILRWYTQDQGYEHVEAVQLRIEDRRLGIHRAEAIWALKCEGVIAMDFVDGERFW